MDLHVLSMVPKLCYNSAQCSEDNGNKKLVVCLFCQVFDFRGVR